MHINDLLKIASERKASDLHLKVGSHPVLRINGELLPLVETKRLMQEDTIAMAFSIMSNRQKQKFKDNLEIDIAYSVPGLGRFRCNVFQQRGTVGLVLRVIPVKIMTVRELGLPMVLEKIAQEQRGLILCTGTTGSGKSTSLAAMIDYINSQRTEHIITIEDPIEFLHRDKKSIVNQREVEVDTRSFAAALRSALRQDPDVILVGEMRDGETAQIGMRAAMTGHLVLSTLHTRDTAGTLFRLVDMGVPKYMVASSVQVVLAQRLIRRICESCGEPYTPTPQEAEWLEHAGLLSNDWGTLLRGRGCSHCNGTGYRGRMGVYEMLEMNKVLVDAAAHHDSTHFMQAAREYMQGRTLIDQALVQMKLGRTTVAEVMSVSSQRED